MKKLRKHTCFSVIVFFFILLTTKENNTIKGQVKEGLTSTTIEQKDEPRIIITSEENNIYLGIDADSADRENIWIDLNGNGKKDNNEAVEIFNKHEEAVYTKTAKTIVIYGNVSYLECSKNAITNLDVSKNTTLQQLYCHRNLLTSLDLTNNSNLEYLQCQLNRLTHLDVNNNTKLINLYCESNLLKHLDVNKNTRLEKLLCNNNLLSHLNVSKNINLKTLSCNNNQLKALNISQNANLNSFDCSNNGSLMHVEVNRIQLKKIPTSWNKSSYTKYKQQ